LRIVWRIDTRSGLWFSRSSIYTLYMWKTFDDSSDCDTNGVSGSSSMGHCPNMTNCLTYSHHKIRRTLIYAYAYIAFQVAVSLYASSSQIRSGHFCNTLAAKLRSEVYPRCWPVQPWAFALLSLAVTCTRGVILHRLSRSWTELGIVSAVAHLSLHPAPQ
jgi:hypothetical protein